MATVTSIPFAAFSHIALLSDGRVVELSCPICNGNARADSPNYFFNGTKAVLSHISRIHETSTIKTTGDLLASPALRVLANDEYDAIFRGEHTSIIVKRTASNVDGAAAKTKTQKADMPIPHYPNVILTKDGRYLQLNCVFCEANAQTKRGGPRFSTSRTDNIEFFKGTHGMLGHIVNAHKSKLGGKTTTLEWVVENCGEELCQESVDVLEADTLCSLLDMVKAPGRDNQDEEGQRSTLNNAAMAASLLRVIEGSETLHVASDSSIRKLIVQ